MLVATTQRLLDYRVMTRTIRLHPTTSPDGQTEVDISGDEFDAPLTPAALAGLTLHVADPERVVLTAGGQRVPVVVNPPADDDGPSISVAWPRLQFPTM